jgi:hypothetical protein
MVLKRHLHGLCMIGGAAHVLRRINIGNDGSGCDILLKNE